jgi:hypothetical protein
MANERTSRKAEEAQARRRRQPGTLDRMQQLKLAVPDQVRKDNENYALRWINDSGNRMHFMTAQDDWDKVPEVQPVPVGTAEDGKPIYAHLCRKPKEFWDEDQKAKIDASRERERGLLRSARSDPADNRPEAVSYVPEGNSITSGFTP